MMPTNLQMMSNDEFLYEVVFKHRRLEDGFVFTCSVVGDPTTAKYPFSGNYDRPDANNFFCVSTLGGDKRRTPQNFDALFCIVVDDVGTKVQAEDVLCTLGTPTWAIETSPGNLQWGYRLSHPVRDLAVANGIIEGLCRTFTGDVAGVNRLVRLPVGVNSKPKYGTPPPKTELVSVTDIEISPGFAAGALAAVPTPLPTSPSKFLPPDEDPVLNALDDYEATLTPGTYKITCPWVSDHTDGRNDGAAYMAPAGFKCHHGHCKDKTFKDLREHLGLTAREIDKVIGDAAVREFTSSAEAFNSGNASPPAHAPKSPHIPVEDQFYDNGDGMSKDVLQQHFPRHWMFKGTTLANTCWLLSGTGGLGKSRLAMAMAMAGACGLPVGPFVPGNLQGVRTVFMTAEDDDAEKGHRFTTQLRWFQKHDARWKDPAVLARLGANLYMPNIDPAEGLSVKVKADMQLAQAMHGPYQLAIWDPLIMFWQGEDDQGLNSASGARDTINALVDLTRTTCIEAGLPFSVGIIHHLNKGGTVLGSVMVENLVRTAFKLVRDDVAHAVGAPRATLKVDKANGLSLTDAECSMYLETPDAVVHFKGDFKRQTRDERVADAICTGAAQWDVDRSVTVAQLASVLLVLADTVTDRKALIKAVLDGWDDMSDMELTILGLTRVTKGKLNLYKPQGA